MRRSLLSRALADRAAGQSVALVTDLQSGLQCLIDEHGIDGSFQPDEDATRTIREALSTDRPGLVADGRLFVQIVAPAPRLIIIGAVHIAQALAKMAVLVGFAPVIVDPRGAFANPARFPDIALCHDWPDIALRDLAPDRRSAVVALTHDPKLDDPALITALRSPAFYIGALGSRKTQAARRERLLAEGFASSDLARIRGPVGLRIGAVSAPEIAVSILAEIIATRRGEAGQQP